MQRNVKAMSRAAAVIRLSITTATPPAITPIDRRAKITGSTKSNVTRASAGCADRRRRRGAGTCAQGPKARSEEHTSELQSRFDIVCRLLLEKKMESTQLEIDCAFSVNN